MYDYVFHCLWPNDEFSLHNNLYLIFLLHQVAMVYKIRNGLVKIRFPPGVKSSTRSCALHMYCV